MPEESFLTVKLPVTVVEMTDLNPGAGKTSLKQAKESDIFAPKWGHWRQRKLTRLWYATLLSMNVEPSIKARSALKSLHPERYQIYKDRLAIGKARLGHDLPHYEDHLNEGDGVGEKYVDLIDYLEFSNDLGWSGLEPMREGLGIESNPSKPQELRQNLKNNLLVLLNEALMMQVPGYDIKKPAESSVAVHKWFFDNSLRMPVEKRSLSGYLAEISDAVAAYDKREKHKLNRIDTDRVHAAPSVDSQE